MEFVARDGAVIAERGPGDTSRKPELAAKFRRDVVDPLSVISGDPGGAAPRRDPASRFPVYDGARRFDAIVMVQPRNQKEPAIHLDLTLKAIAGFKGE